MNNIKNDYAINIDPDSMLTVYDRFTGRCIIDIATCGETGFLLDDDGFIGVVVDMPGGMGSRETRRNIAAAIGYAGAEDCFKVCSI